MGPCAAAPSPAPRAMSTRASSRIASRPSWSASPGAISSAKRSRRNITSKRRRSRSSTISCAFCRAWAEPAPVSVGEEEEGLLASIASKKPGQVIVVTSGKGGVGKTTTSAAIAAGLAIRGHKTVVIDFDVGLRNLDLVMGCERRVVFDFINVLNGDAKLNQALIRDKRLETLYVFPTSQTRDKDALKAEGVASVMAELRDGFDYVVCDSPAGIERGALTAL